MFTLVFSVPGFCLVPLLLDSISWEPLWGVIGGLGHR